MSLRIPRALRALIVVMALMLAGTGALAGSIEVRLNASAKVYSSLDSSAKSVKAPKGLRVSLRSYSRGWGKVAYKGRVGFIRLKYLDRVNPLKAYVTQSATVYRSASTARKLGTVPQGTTVYALGVDGSYVRIIGASGKWGGYIQAGVLSSSRSAAQGSSTGTSGKGSLSSLPEKLRATAEGAKKSRVEMAVYVAQALVGAPYGEDADPPRTFDCAHYTHYCYDRADVSLKGSSRSQGEDERFEKIERIEDLKRGDLVCFNTVADEDLTDHVGIYLGGGYFLHASSVARQVIVSQLKSGYYNRVFSWGRRIFAD